MKFYKLLKNYEDPYKSINAGTINSSEGWNSIFSNWDIDINFDEKKDWFEEVKPELPKELFYKCNEESNRPHRICYNGLPGTSIILLSMAYNDEFHKEVAERIVELWNNNVIPEKPKSIYINPRVNIPTDIDEFSWDSAGFELKKLPKGGFVIPFIHGNSTIELYIKYHENPDRISVSIKGEESK